MARQNCHLATTSLPCTFVGFLVHWFIGQQTIIVVSGQKVWTGSCDTVWQAKFGLIRWAMLRSAQNGQKSAPEHLKYLGKKVLRGTQNGPKNAPKQGAALCCYLALAKYRQGNGQHCCQCCQSTDSPISWAPLGGNTTWATSTCTNI